MHRRFTLGLLTLVAAALVPVTAVFAQQMRPGTGKGLKAHESTVRAIAISPDGTMAASAASDVVKIWSLPDFTAVRSWDKFPARVLRATFSPDFKAVAIALEDGSIQAWGVPGGERIASWQSSPPGEKASRVAALSFSPDGTLLASGDENRVARVWSFPQGRLLHSLQHENGVVHSLAFAGGAILATAAGTNRDAYLWSLPGAEKVAPLQGHASYLQNVAITPDAQWLVSSSNYDIKIWSLRERRVANSIEEPRERGLDRLRGGASAINRDGRWLATVESHSWRTEDRKPSKGRTGEIAVVLRQLPELRVITRLQHPDAVTSLALSPDSSMLVAGDQFGVIYRWDLAKMGIRPQ